MIDLQIRSTDFAQYYQAQVKQRNQLLQAAQTSDEVKKILIAKCQKDVVFFVNTFIVTYNPRVKPSVLPMILFPRQCEMLLFLEDCYRSKSWGIINKSRYTGASVICISFLLHKFLFEADFSGSLSSNKADSVDRLGDPDSLFSKLEQIYLQLPTWLKPFDMKANRKTKLVFNPYNNSTIKGYSGQDIGRGGRSSLAIVDELAHVEQDESAVSAMSENTDCMIGVSTPKGRNNEHYRLFTNDEVKKFTFNWRDDPRRDDDWAKKQRIKLGDAIFDQELECSFDAFTGSSYLKAELVDYLFNTDYKLPTNFPEEYENANCYGGLDLAVGGDATILAILKEYEVIAIYQLSADIDSALREIEYYSRKHDLRALAYDICGLGQLFAALASKVLSEDFGAEILPYNAASTQPDLYIDGLDMYFKESMYNNRAYYYYRLYSLANNTKNFIAGELTDDDVFGGKKILRLPNEPKLRDDLTKPSADYRGGKLLIQSKSDMAKEGKTSTDYSDAVVCALFAQDYLES
jgi:phage terminase large subunit